MKRTVRSITALAVFVVTLSLLYPQQASGKSWPEDVVVFELVGQVKNFPGPPPTSQQFGYLSWIKDLDGIFTTDNPAAQNESSALFTFFNNSTTLRVIVHGGQRIVNREGTTTVYFDDTPDGNFATPDTFQDGIPIQTSSFRHQVILDFTTQKFTTTFEQTITAVEPFIFNGKEVKLGKVGHKFRVEVSGLPDLVLGPGNFKIAGYAVSLGSK